MRQFVVVGSGVLWLLVICAGLGGLSWYAKQPGQAATPPAQWPAETGIQRAAGHANLVMLLHPRCPCSRASIEELDRLLARVGNVLAVHVRFFKPLDFGEDWEKTDLWRSAAAIPGVDVRVDDDGREARVFRAATSGQTILYDAAGRLLFSGGITASRGHAGDNDGREAIVALLTTARSSAPDSPVFGCSLLPSSEAAGSVGW